MSTFRSAGIASSAILIASRMAFLPSSSRLTANESGYATGGQVAVGVATAWTTVRGTFLMAAVRAAQDAAKFDAGEPSAATTMPSFLDDDIRSPSTTTDATNLW